MYIFNFRTVLTAVGKGGSKRLMNFFCKMSANWF